MYPISINEVPNDFSDCWFAAIQHIDSRTDPDTIFYIKQDLTPPLLEHISFRFGNQVFCIHVCDDLGDLSVPSSQEATIVASEKANGIPCKMVMKKTADGWLPASDGWGLTHLRTGSTVVPEELITDELIEMSDWELQDFAIQIVRYVLEQKGNQIRSWVPDPKVNPQLWFIDPNGAHHFVIVKWVRYPEIHAALPNNISDIVEMCSAESDSGFFVSVTIANPAQQIDNPDDLNLLDPNAPQIEVQPLWRGSELLVDLTDLVSIDKVLIQ